MLRILCGDAFENRFRQVSQALHSLSQSRHGHPEFVLLLRRHRGRHSHPLPFERLMHAVEACDDLLGNRPDHVNGVILSIVANVGDGPIWHAAQCSTKLIHPRHVGIELLHDPSPHPWIEAVLPPTFQEVTVVRLRHRDDLDQLIRQPIGEWVGSAALGRSSLSRRLRAGDTAATARFSGRGLRCSCGFPAGFLGHGDGGSRSSPAGWRSKRR